MGIKECNNAVVGILTAFKEKNVVPRRRELVYFRYVLCFSFKETCRMFDKPEHVVRRWMDDAGMPKFTRDEKSRLIALHNAYNRMHTKKCVPPSVKLFSERQLQSYLLQKGVEHGMLAVPCPYEYEEECKA